MDELNKAAELKDEELDTVSGGWQRREGARGTVIETKQVNNVWCYVYRIAGGDNLSSIAWAFGWGANYQYLADFNGLPNPNYIQAGKTLNIPVVKGY